MGLCLACSNKRLSKVEKPEAPDMSELIAAYEMPSGTLDAEALRAVDQFVESNLGTLQSLGIDQQLIDALHEGISEADSSMQAERFGTQRQSLTVEGDGYLEITRICNGWGSEPVPDRDQNGYLELIVGFTDAGLDPVLWGDVERCLYLVGQSQVSVEPGTRERQGDFRLYIGENATFDNAVPEPVLFDLDVTAALDGSPVNLRIDFRIDIETRAMELRIGTGSGDLIALASPDGWFGVRAKNGTFTCDTTARTCQDAAGQPLTY
jgi:hypothetical protein